jgi:hypothetical protein
MLATASLHAAGWCNRVKNWFTAQPTREQLQCPEFIQYTAQPTAASLVEDHHRYDPFIFQDLPFDVQRHVLLLIANNEDIEKSTTIIRSFLQTSKQNNILNTNNFYQTVIEVIARKYGILPQLVELYVGSQINRMPIEKYLRDNAPVVFELHQQAKYLDYLLNSKKSHAVLKLLTEKIPLLRAHNEPDCVVLWQYQNKSYVCIKTPVQLPLETVLARKTIIGYDDKSFGGQIIEYPNVTLTAESTGRTKILNTVLTSDVALQRTGKIVLLLEDLTHGFIIMRFNQNGTLDTSFAQNGFLALNVPLSTEEIFSYFYTLITSNRIIYHLFVDPKNDFITFKIKDIIMRFTQDGKQLP